MIAAGCLSPVPLLDGCPAASLPFLFSCVTSLLMAWITRDFRCDDCGDEHYEIVESPFPIGRALDSPCVKCGGVSVCATIAATALTPTLVVGSEAHEAAIESRAKAHDKLVHQEYWGNQNMRVPRRFR